MKNPVVFLLQFIAWVMLAAIILVTWAGVTYPVGRAKPNGTKFSMIHPLCFHRVFMDEQYESNINLEICHTEFRNHPLDIRKAESYIGAQEITEVSTSKQIEEGILTVGYRMTNADQNDSFLISLFYRFPDGSEYSSLGGASFNIQKGHLGAHFMIGGKDRCAGGFIENHGVIDKGVIALSHAATLNNILNPKTHSVIRDNSALNATFPEWEASNLINNNPASCVGRLLETYNWQNETSEITAIAVDLGALIGSPQSQIELCIADSIVRTRLGTPSTTEKFTIFSVAEWNEVLSRVHQRCGQNTTFLPFNFGI